MFVRQICLKFLKVKYVETAIPNTRHITLTSQGSSRKLMTSGSIVLFLKLIKNMYGVEIKLDIEIHCITIHGIILSFSLSI